MIYHLAIDIGASGGRHILGWEQDGKLELEEVFRFENGVKKQGSSLIWDIDELEKSVKEGIKKCGETGKIPQTVSIDTWGVDYVLLDKNKDVIYPVYAYRDSRMESVMEKAEEIMPFSWLYSRTGIQKQNFNTVYQLMCEKESGRIDKAEHFMMIPDYLGYTLCGRIANEYTNATTSGMINAQTCDWDDEIINRIGVSRKLFLPLSQPGEELGDFSEEMREYAGFNAKVVLCGSHDTASAVAAAPIDEGGMYISSGTWSLIGAEMKVPTLAQRAMKANFTNEGGISHTYRFLKNIMGMWLLQNIRKNIGKSKTYDEMMYMAMDCKNYSYIDTNDPSIVAPDNMIEAVSALMGKKDAPLEEVLATVYHSLARSYRLAVEEVEAVTGTEITCIAIVGGGSSDAYLNSLTAEYTGKKVIAGPKEATAVGNIAAQLLYSGEIGSVAEGREMIKRSSFIKPVKKL